MRAGVVNNELNTFLSSIKLSPELQRNDQYLSNDTGMSQGVKMGLIAGGSVLIIALVVVLINKRKNALA
jgi:LPXTG-motif cell wall-anchored protein